MSNQYINQKFSPFIITLIKYIPKDKIQEELIDTKILSTFIDTCITYNNHELIYELVKSTIYKDVEVIYDAIKQQSITKQKVHINKMIEYSLLTEEKCIEFYNYLKNLSDKRYCNELEMWIQSKII